MIFKKNKNEMVGKNTMNIFRAQYEIERLTKENSELKEEIERLKRKNKKLEETVEDYRYYLERL